MIRFLLLHRIDETDNRPGLMLALLGLTIIVGSMLTGCAKDPEQRQRVNARFDVDTLFTKDGCTVYRFDDNGHFHYFTNCSGATMSRESCGKNCTHDVSIAGGRQ